MDLFHKIMALIDKNSDKIPEGDYLELCDTIHELRRQVKPPSFLLDQNQPLTYAPMTDGQPHDWMDDELPSDPDTAAQRAREELRQRWRELDEEVMYPGLNQFLQELHEEWSATDNIGPVEPGAYYPPPRDGTTVAEVSMMDID
jgi:hypothetical protein